jgi:hypothetical protein
MENKIVYSNTNSARDRDTKDQPRKTLSGISIRSDNKEELYPTLGNNFNNFTSNFNNLNSNSYGSNPHQEDNLYKLYKNNMLNNSPSTNRKENPVVKKSEHDSNVMEMTATMK